MTLYYLNEGDRGKLREVIRRTEGGGGSSRPLPRRRRGPRSLPGTSSTMLLVTVNQNIPSDQAEFTVDKEYYEVIFGSEERDFVTIVNEFDQELAVNTTMPVWKRESDGKYIPDRVGDSEATMVLCQIQTDTSAAKVSIDRQYYTPVFGSEDRDSITIDNTHSEAFKANTEVPCWKRLSDGEYVPDRTGGEESEKLVGFRLKFDLAKDADYGTAEIIDRFANVGEEISVWNENRQFTGKGPWTDPRGSHVGFRGFCVATGEIHNDLPLYRIVTMEGLMRDIAVQLAADQNDAVADTPVVPLDITRYGHPWNGRFPAVVSGTNQFTAQDPLNVAKGGKLGQRFWVKYSAPDDEYHFVDTLEVPTMLHVTLPSNTSASSINVAAANYRVVFGKEDRATITIDNVWDEEFNGGDRLTVFKRPDGLYEADRAGGAGAATALFITIPSGTFVYDETETYLIPDTAYRVIYGEENRVQVSVVNTFNETLEPGDELVVFKRDADGQYEPDRKGPASNNTMLHITTTGEKSGPSFIVLASEYRVVYGSETRSSIWVDNVFGETFPTGTKFTAFLNSSGDYEPDRGGQGTGATMVYGTIATTTSAIDFNVTTYTVVFGTEERVPIPVYNEQAETFVAGSRVPLWKRNSDGKYVADRKGSSDATMVVGRCTENVYGEDLTFNISRDLVVFGTETRVLVPVNNRYGEEFQVNEYVPVWKRVSDDIYEPDRKGSGLNIAMVKATVQSDTSSSFTTSSYSVVFGSEVRSSITVNNTYNEQFKAGDVVPCWRRSLDTTYEPDRAAEGGGGTMVIATIPSGTSAATVVITNYEEVFGSETRPSITLNNTYNETFESNDRVPCWKRDDDGTYEPDRSGEMAALQYGTANQYIGINGSGQATLNGESVSVVNRTNRAIFRNSNVTVDRREDWIIASNSPTALSATSSTNSPSGMGDFSSWSNLTFGSVSDADVTNAALSISDEFDILQFVRAGDRVGFFVRDGTLVPVQMEWLSRDYEKLSWVCNLDSAGAGETLSKVLGKPQTPSGDLCDPKWFDPPDGGQPDTYYEALFDTWIGEWLTANTTVTPFVRSIESIDLTETTTTIQVQINFTTSTAKMIQPGGSVATNRQGDTPAEEACT